MFVKGFVRYAVIAGLVGGTALLIAGPERLSALFSQAKGNINTRIDTLIDVLEDVADDVPEDVPVPATVRTFPSGATTRTTWDRTVEFHPNTCRQAT